jgi:uncharacterized metal-binding protein YceD (DUF177 family)
MKVHLNQIPAEGIHLEGEEHGDILDLREEAIRQAGPVRYALDVGLSEGGLFATGTLAVDLDLECVSCLRRFHYPLEIDSFALQTELEGAETVDLTPFVREDIVLALPPHPHCDWDGSQECQGVKDFTSEPLPEKNVWEELDKLKVK